MALRTPKVSVLCFGSEGPCEGWGQRRLVRGDAAPCKPLVFIIPPRVLHNGLSCVLPYAAKRQPMENRLAGLTSSPPVTRRAVVARWTKVCHFHLLLGSE